MKAACALSILMFCCATAAAQTALSTAALDAGQLELLRLAARAPSGHNTQPWRITVRDGKWILSLREQALLPAVDINRREAVLSAGAFLESLRLAAGAKGLRLQVRVPAQNNLQPELAELNFSSCAPTGFDVSELRLRRTLRKNFKDSCRLS